MRHMLFLGLALVLVLGLGFWAGTLYAAGYGERLTNGSFEEGFGENGVALGWTAFNNGGSAEYIYRDDVGPRFIVDGKHSQFIRLSTLPYFSTEPDRYSGIYQTVKVAAGMPYTFTLSGMLRVLPGELNKNDWSYVVQWGMDPNGGTDWGKVVWNDVPWGTTYNEDDTGAMSKFTTTFNAPSNKITLFIRALKKWPTGYRVLFVNLDGVSLTGAAPAAVGITGESAPKVDVVVPTFVYTTKPFKVHVTASGSAGVSQIYLYEEGKLVTGVAHAVGLAAKEVDLTWTPAVTGTRTLLVQVIDDNNQLTNSTHTVQVMPIAEFLKNGSFEGGFAPNGVAAQWSSFNNGGRNIALGFLDDSWKPAVGNGSHSQLIDISTLAFNEGDPESPSDRHAGICQVLTGLTPQASYYLNASGILRVTEGDQHTDDWSWTAQWGYIAGADPSCSRWNQVTSWDVFPWGHVDYRESPGAFNSYTTVFYAPANTITVYFDAWKKWAIGAREFLVNFDNLSIAGYKAP